VTALESGEVFDVEGSVVGGAVVGETSAQNRRDLHAHRPTMEENVSERTRVLCGKPPT
jgi:hypothetical protein